MLHTMLEWVVAVMSAFGVVFVAELGDKTQLLALGFGARHRLGVVAIGLAIGYGAAGALAASIGGVLGSTLPERPVGLVAGAVFIAFAVLTLIDDRHGSDHIEVAVRSVVASIALTITLAEMGDKTQISTAALAARANPIAVWIGATAGATASGMIGAAAGSRLGTRIDPGMLRIASAVLFAVFGVVLVVTAW